MPDQPRHHINDTGTGNTINMANGKVVQLVLDSLRHWVQSYHVDGFRFDLGSTLGREPEGFEQGSGFFDALLQDPVLSNVKLIAEPWDIGPGGYQLGNFPPGFSEWNDRFRDGVRRFWRGDPNQVGDLAARLSGSADIFNHQHRRPIASINYLASHDGFTLEDIVSYEQRHNEANGENNNDGHGENYSNNWGAEGRDRRCEHPRAARARKTRDADHAVLLARHADAARRRRIRPDPATATTTRIARTTKSPGSTGACSTRTKTARW